MGLWESRAEPAWGRAGQGPPLGREASEPRSGWELPTTDFESGEKIRIGASLAPPK